jgi:soluble lytic murein transglycosylase-like protein
VGCGRALSNAARRRLLAAVVAGGAACLSPAPARAEIALLASGQTLKLDAHREQAGLLVLVLKGGGEVHLPPAAVRGFVPDEVVEELERAASGGELRALVEQAARRRGLDPALVLAVVAVESGFRPDAVSPKGAQGLMQLMPRTAASLGVEDAFDPEQNLDAGVRHLESLLKLYDGNLTRALAAYNAGQGAVARHGGVPPYRETREYVRRVLERYRAKQSP